MANQDLLHAWWWSTQGPKKQGPITIHTLEENLLKAREAGVVHGRDENNDSITGQGWNYAVLKFLIEYCTLPFGLTDTLKKCAKDNKYQLWKMHSYAVISVNKKL